MRSPIGTFVKTEVWAEVVSEVRPSWGPGGGEQAGMGGRGRVGSQGARWGQLSAGREPRVRTLEGEVALLWSESSLVFVGLPDRNTQFQI